MSGPFELKPLPFNQNALEPVISAQTISFHYGKHHKAYVDKLNDLVKDSPLAGMSLEEIIEATHGKENQKEIYNNAAQVWNHDFYWQCLRPGTSQASGLLKELLCSEFGSVVEFQKKFAQAGVEQFGSGYAWLVATPDKKVKIVKTGNAENPLHTENVPILNLDVWEHAYYLDYQNLRPEYAKAVTQKLLNWEFAEQNLATGGAYLSARTADVGKSVKTPSTPSF